MVISSKHEQGFMFLFYLYGGIMKNYRVNYVDLPTGETIAYRKAGRNKQTLLFLHGNMSSSVHFQPLMEMFEKHFTVYSLDLVGFGDSSYNRQIESLEDFSKDVTAFIEHFDLKDLYIMGWSTGGGVALEAAVDNVDRVKGIFLLSSVGVQGLKVYKQKMSRFGTIISERISKREDIETDPLQAGQHMLAIQNMDKDFFKLLWELIYIKNEPSEEDFDKFVEAVMKQRNLVDVIHALANFNMTTSFNGVNNGSGRLYQLRCPIVIMHGDEDIVVPIADAETSADFIGERAELIKFKGCGHSLLTDDKDRVYVEVVSRIEI